MTHETATLTGAGGRSIFWQSWTPGQVTGVVVLVHGFGEHSGRYGHVVERLNALGLRVYAPDHHGHGRSDGARAVIERLDIAVADLDALVVLAAAANPGLPVFMLGHSMGGLIALRYAVAHQDRLSGLLLSGPLAAYDGTPAPLRFVGRMLSAVAPRVGVMAIDPELVSRDPAVVAAYRADPLVHHGKVPARTAAEFVAAIDALPGSVGAIRIPVLLMFGTADRLCPPAGSEMVAAQIGSGDITVKRYDGLYHEIFNEPERDAVLDDVAGWMRGRLAERAGSSNS